jgi:hypothetical protein
VAQNLPLLTGLTPLSYPLRTINQYAIGCQPIRERALEEEDWISNPIIRDARPAYRGRLTRKMTAISKHRPSTDRSNGTLTPRSIINQNQPN